MPRVKAPKQEAIIDVEETVTPASRNTIFLGEDPKAEYKANRIYRPTWRERAMALAHGVKTHSVTRKLQQVHNMSAREATETSYQIAERVSGEISGFLTGTVRALSGFIAGTAAGLAFGLRGATPAQLKAIRLRSATLTALGTWSEQSSRIINKQIVPTVKMQLTRDFYGNEADPNVDYELPITNASEVTLTIKERDTVCLIVMLTDMQTNMTSGYVVLAQDDSRAVYLYTE